MEINKNNIEAYLLDYSEGNLTAEQERELQLFVLLNPEYKELYEQCSELPVITSDSEEAHLKTSLRKYSFVSSDEAFVKELEGELTYTEKEELKDMLQHFPELHKERERFALTVLQPVQIIYPEKELLKRRSGVLITLYPHVLRIAALFLITLLTATGIYFLLKHDNKQKMVADDVQRESIPVTLPSEPKDKPINEIRVDDKSIPSSVLAGNKKPVQIRKKKAIEVNDNVSEQLADIPVLTKMKSLDAALNIEIAQLPVMKAFVQEEERTTPVNNVPVKDDAHYMDVNELASKFISKFSKGKVNFIHKKTDEGNFTELAVNTGDFEFIRKKSK